MGGHRLEALHMVRGMGVGMKVLELLASEIREVGGNPEILVFMTRPRFKGNVERIAQAFIDCDWRIPVTEMQYRAEAQYRKEFEAEADKLQHVRNLWWTGVLLDLGIPFDHYGDSDDPRIPLLYRNQLRTRTMSYPLLLDCGGGIGNRVVVDFITKSGWGYPEPGQPIQIDGIQSISVADSRYFDFDR